MNRKKLMTYLIWSFGLTWICDGMIIASHYLHLELDILRDILNALGAIAPAVAACIVLKKYNITEERKPIWRFIFDFPKRIWAYVILFGFMFWRFLVFYLNRDIAGSDSAYMLFLWLIVMLLFGGGFEEPGWRGFLQPYFEKKYPFTISILCVSTIWAVWHIPLWFIPGSAQNEMNFILFFFQLFVNACSLAAILKLTKSVVLCMIYHAWGNAVFVVILIELNIGIIIAYALEAVIALVICYVYDKRNREKAFTQ